MQHMLHKELSIVLGSLSLSDLCSSHLWERLNGFMWALNSNNQEFQGQTPFLFLISLTLSPPKTSLVKHLIVRCI